MLLNKQRLNCRKLLLSCINYHRRSEFTEKISHRPIVIKSAKQDNQKTRTFYKEHIDDTNESVEENTQTIQQTIPTQQKQQNEKEDVLAMVFYVIGLITILIGFVSAISEANIIYFLTGGISGLLFLGFGEIISLLYSICKKLDK